jgi:hypothetical protein
MSCILKKINGVILKLDFEKTYNKVKWSFVQQTLRMKGFSDEWCALINSSVSRDSVVIKVNDYVSTYFRILKGLRQGNMLSPMLFHNASTHTHLIGPMPTDVLPHFL